MSWSGNTRPSRICRCSWLGYCEPADCTADALQLCKINSEHTAGNRPPMSFRVL